MGLRVHGKDLGCHEVAFYSVCSNKEKVKLSGGEVKSSNFNIHLRTWPLELTLLKGILKRGFLLSETNS